jgi:hypothetical protein
MAISRKPKPRVNTADTGTGVDIDALINKGGSVGAGQTPPTLETASRAAETATVNLRMPVALVEQIDDALKSHPIRKPRHTWLLEAVVEKLNRESA